MTTFVLVHGFWIGGWAWRDVACALRERGQDVFTPTLTGLGERAHLARADVDLQTHIDDVVNVMRYEDLHDVILVGHSYAGVVITGVADREPSRIAKLVYLDSGPISGGSPYFDYYPPPARAYVEQSTINGGVPMPSLEDLEKTFGASLAGISEEQREMMRERAVAQPIGSLTTPLRLDDPDRAPLPKIAILCSFSSDQLKQLIDADHPMTKEMAGPEWTFLDLPTGHWPMFSRPKDVAWILDELAR